MKKTISILSLLLDLLVCVPFMTACGDDDDDNPIFGRWYRTEKYGWNQERVFNSDYTFTHRVYRNEILKEEINGKFKIEGNELTLIFDDHYSYLQDHYSGDAHIDGTYTIVIEGKEMIIGNEVWHKTTG